MSDEKKEPEYVSSDGRRTPVSKLDDTHLVNALRKIERGLRTTVPNMESALVAHPTYPHLKRELLNRCEKTRAWYDERVRAGK